VALLLALARRLPEASNGFEPGRWGEPAGRSLAGTAACIVGAGAVGTEIARRLAAFDVTVTGVRRHPPSGPVPPFAAVYTADRLLDRVADVDSVIIAAGYQAGQPPLVDDPVLRAMRPGAWLVNIARGALLDTEAASRTSTRGTWRASGSTCSRPSPTPPTGHCSSTRTLWRPPTPLPSPATTSPPPADVSARTSLPTSMINRPPGSSGSPDQTFSAVQPDTYRP
jgi:phosphoglycerate dehydrogenase-like enzyme